MTSPSYIFIPQALLAVKGDKAAAFLHGQLTNSIKDLKENTGNYNLLLTNKGKIQAGVFVCHYPFGFELSVACEQVDLLKEHLKKLAPLSRCVVEDVSKDIGVCLLIDPHLPEFTNIESDHITKLTFDGCEVHVYRSHRLGEGVFDVRYHLCDRDRLEDFFQAQGFRVASESSLEQKRILGGFAKVGVDATEKNLPQEAQLDRALHFDKGCYLGQEVVARLKYRGQLKKILVRLKALDLVLTPGDEVYIDDKACGVVTSSCEDEGVGYALAYIPFDKKDPGQKLWVNGACVEVF